MSKRKHELIGRVAEAMGRLASIYCAEGESLSQLRQRAEQLCERDVGRVAIFLEEGLAILAGETLDRHGWSWRQWGTRSHWLDRPDRTACGRTWRGGLVQASRPAHACRTCARIVAVRQSSPREEARECQ